MGKKPTGSAPIEEKITGSIPVKKSHFRWLIRCVDALHKIRDSDSAAPHNEATDCDCPKCIARKVLDEYSGDDLDRSGLDA
jgi:hypothetical protein